VLTVLAEPKTPYQLTEFIALMPQGAYPLDVLPSHMVDVLFLDGEKKRIIFPLVSDGAAGKSIELTPNPRALPMVYRFYAHRDDRSAAMYFSPDYRATMGGYWPFYDRGQMVTPTYWGSHWPLRRGKWTHWKIDDDIYSGPTHSSIASWLSMPTPLSTATYAMPDSLGKSKEMAIKRWTALIANTDAPDKVLLDWAESFSNAPSIAVTGARVDFPSYSPERRALRLVAEASSIEINLTPVALTVNPVFEFARTSKELVRVTIDGKAMSSGAYAWDGKTLWMNRTIDRSGAKIAVVFR
jgi:hypothetical protein